MPDVSSIAFAIASLCSSAFQVGTLEKFQCQDFVSKCVIQNTKPMDSQDFKEREVLKCYLKWRKVRE